MPIPKDVVRFEILLYASLLIDALSVAIFGVGSGAASEATRAFDNLLTAFLIAALAFLVWLAARRRKNWARWTLLAVFTLTLFAYAATLGQLTFGLRAVMDMVSMVLTVCGFFFSFTAQAGQWFRS
jgi:CHASE2 domain-containing sensor protein